MLTYLEFMHISIKWAVFGSAGRSFFPIMICALFISKEESMMIISGYEEKIQNLQANKATEARWHCTFVSLSYFLYLSRLHLFVIELKCQPQRHHSRERGIIC